MPEPDAFFDPATHSLCRRCRRWKPNGEGERVLLEPFSVFGRLRQLREQLTRDDEGRVFVCHACIRRRRRNQRLLYLAFALAVGAALLRGWLVDGRL